VVDDGSAESLVAPHQGGDVLLEVLADAEGPAPTGQDDTAHLGVVGDLLQDRDQPLLEGQVDGVHGVRPVQHHRRDAGVDEQLDDVSGRLRSSDCWSDVVVIPPSLIGRMPCSAAVASFCRALHRARRPISSRHNGQVIMVSSTSAGNARSLVTSQLGPF
jgi:hypothetical protein